MTTEDVTAHGMHASSVGWSQAQESGPRQVGPSTCSQTSRHSNFQPCWKLALCRAAMRAGAAVREPGEGDRVVIVTLAWTEMEPELAASLRPISMQQLNLNLNGNQSARVLAAASCEPCRA